MNKQNTILQFDLRSDGRKYEEIRKMKINLGKFYSYDGYCDYTHGLNKISVTIKGPKPINSKRNFCQGKVNIFITTSIFANGDRKEEKKKKIRKDHLIQETVEKTLKTTLILDLYVNSEIDIYIIIIQQDAGLKTSILNACTIALVHSGIALYDLPFACEAKIINKRFLVGN